MGPTLSGGGENAVSRTLTVLCGVGPESLSPYSDYAQHSYYRYTVIDGTTIGSHCGQIYDSSGCAGGKRVHSPSARPRKPLDAYWLVGSLAGLVSRRTERGGNSRLVTIGVHGPIEKDWIPRAHAHNQFRL